jgi:hypothetical protein
MWKEYGMKRREFLKSAGAFTLALDLSSRWAWANDGRGEVILDMSGYVTSTQAACLF